MVSISEQSHVENPLSGPLASTLRLVRSIRDEKNQLRDLLSAALDVIHDQEQRIEQLERANRHMRDQLRPHRSRRGQSAVPLAKGLAA